MIWTHVSELSIDQLLAGELHRADEAAIRDHAGECTRCGGLLADALAAQEAFAHVRPRLALPRWYERFARGYERPARGYERPARGYERPARWRRSAPAMAAACALAAGLAFALWPHPDAAVRTKGTAILGGFIAHGDGVRRAGPHERVATGDRVELYTTTDAPAWFAAVGADGTVYVAPVQVPAGRERVLPMSIALDGSETVTGIFCPEAFDPAAPPATCTTDRLELVAP
jgi:hypothetical protein